MKLNSMYTSKTISCYSSVTPLFMMATNGQQSAVMHPFNQHTVIQLKFATWWIGWPVAEQNTYSTEERVKVMISKKGEGMFSIT